MFTRTICEWVLLFFLLLFLPMLTTKYFTPHKILICVLVIINTEVTGLSDVIGLQYSHFTIFFIKEEVFPKQCGIE